MTDVSTLPVALAQSRAFPQEPGARLTIRFLGHLHECHRGTTASFGEPIGTLAPLGYWFDATPTLPTLRYMGRTRAQIIADLRNCGIGVYEQTSRTTRRTRTILFVLDNRTPYVTIAPRDCFVSTREARDLALRADRMLGQGRKARLAWAAGVLSTSRVHSFRSLTQIEASDLRVGLLMAESSRGSLDPTPWLSAPLPDEPPPMRDGAPMYAAAA